MIGFAGTLGAGLFNDASQGSWAINGLQSLFGRETAAFGQSYAMGSEWQQLLTSRYGAENIAAGNSVADVSGLIFTFRGDSGDISTIFAEGIEAKGTSTDLLAHALDSGAPPSAFVPTSRMFDVAEGFNSEQIFVIRPIGGIDINATLGPLSPFPGENEIAIPEWIAPQDIRGVTLPEQGYSTINWSYES